MSGEEQRFIAQARHSLDARSEQLAPAVRAQLRAARATALGAQRRRGREPAWWQAAALAAVVAVVVGVVWFERPAESPSLSLAQAPIDNGGDLEMLLSHDDPEQFQDLEFYYWLEQEGGNAG